jgi:transcriptional regulator of met regulon
LTSVSRHKVLQIISEKRTNANINKLEYIFTASYLCNPVVRQCPTPAHQKAQHALITSYIFCSRMNTEIS